MDILKLLIIIVPALNTYLVANQINDRVFSRTDKYLPKKKKRLNCLFWFYKKGQPVRWLAYWIERITQFIIFLYIGCLFLGNLITGSWDFVTIDFVGYWGLILALYPCFFEIGVDIYVWIRERFDLKYKE